MATSLYILVWTAFSALSCLGVLQAARKWEERVWNDGVCRKTSRKWVYHSTHGGSRIYFSGTEIQVFRWHG